MAKIVPLKKPINAINMKPEQLQLSTYLQIFNDIKNHITAEDFKKYQDSQNSLMHVSLRFNILYYEFKYFCAVYSYDYNRDYLKYFKISLDKDNEDMVELWILNGLISAKQLENVTEQFFIKLHKLNVINLHQVISKVEEQSDFFHEYIIDNCYTESFDKLKNVNDANIKKAILKNARVISFLSNDNPQITNYYKFAIDNDLALIETQTYEICKYAYDKNDKNYNITEFLKNRDVIKQFLDEGLLDLKYVINCVQYCNNERIFTS